jgi:hypothetical protein
MYHYCRQLKYPQYKGKRPPTPASLHQQLACVLALVDAAGIPILAVPGVEADDVLGSLATRAAADGFDVVLVSPDKVRLKVRYDVAELQHATRYKAKDGTYIGRQRRSLVLLHLRLQQKLRSAVANSKMGAAVCKVCASTHATAYLRQLQIAPSCSA